MVIAMKKRGNKQALLRRWSRVGRLSGKCPICGETSLYFDAYDAMCCIWCDQWLEPKCGDPGCLYCARRPQAPSMAFAAAEQAAREAAMRRFKDTIRERYAKRERGAARRKSKLANKTELSFKSLH